jgi:drug/metabolite transporter (DMT)-like permease
MTQSQGVLTQHIAVLILGVNATLMTLISLNAFSLVGWRTFIAALFLSLIIAYKNGKTAFRIPKNFKWLLLAALFTAAHWITLILAIRYAGAALGTLSMMTHPMFSTLIEPLAQRKLPTLNHFKLPLLGLAGILIMTPEFSLNGDTSFGIAIGLVSALCWSVRSTIIKIKLHDIPSDQSIFWQLAVIALVMMPFAFQQPIPQDTFDWSLLLFFAIMGTAIPHTMALGALKVLSVRASGLISSIQPLYSIFFAWIFISQVPTWDAILGGCLIMASSLIETYILLKNKIVQSFAKKRLA